MAYDPRLPDYDERDLDDEKPEYPDMRDYFDEHYP
jgi:hypothetical protein